MEVLTDADFSSQLESVADVECPFRAHGGRNIASGRVEEVGIYCAWDRNGKVCGCCEGFPAFFQWENLKLSTYLTA